MNETLSCLIVDDERQACEALCDLIEKNIPLIEIKNIAHSVEDAFSKFKAVKPDIIFLDIEMPGEDGFKLLEKLEGLEFFVIFVTGYSQYALKAFEFAALDYLLKPVSIDKLKEAVNRARNQKKSQQLAERLEVFSKLMSNPKEQPRKIPIHVKDGFYKFFDINDICVLEADGSYTIVHTLDGGKYTISGNLGKVEKKFPDHLFIRVHGSFTVNLNQVISYDKTMNNLLMPNDLVIHPSERNKLEVLRGKL